MLKIERLNAVSGNIKSKGILRLTTSTVGFSLAHEQAWKLKDSFPGKNLNEIAEMVCKDNTGNITILRIGAGAKEIGLTPNSWAFVMNHKGRTSVYARIPGPGNCGQYFRTGGKWHTRVRPLRGKAKAAILAATKTVS